MTLFGYVMGQIEASYHDLPDGSESKFDQMTPSDRLLYISIALDQLIEDIGQNSLKVG